LDWTGFLAEFTAGRKLYLWTHDLDADCLGEHKGNVKRRWGCLGAGAGSGACEEESLGVVFACAWNWRSRHCGTKKSE
jgi:hypothetical protein